MITAVSGVVPEHRYTQAELTASLAELAGLPVSKLDTLRRIHANAGVEHRHLALPIEHYAETTATFSAANDAFIAVGTDLAERAVSQALSMAGITAADVDLIISTTVTGMAVPSLEARLIARMPFRTDVKRIPIIGLGCVGGAAGIARAHDYLVGHPGHIAVLVSVELCSLTLQRDDVSMANLIASGLFGDGAAAVVLCGTEVTLPNTDDRSTLKDDRPPRTDDHLPRSMPTVLASRSRMYPDTERAMGWDVGTTGLRIVLGAEVPDLVRDHVRADVDTFLAMHGLTRADIGWWVAHPGGPKVLDALSEALQVPPSALGVTWRSLGQIGNLSSSSVLHVLGDTLRDHQPEAGSLGVLMAMGPGFCLELVLLRAPEGDDQPPAPSPNSSAPSADGGR
ncbi:3-oxoacyl-[acyl-carrier-protein] synthase III C-terminal domain-containing protein [soil metagenome]